MKKILAGAGFLVACAAMLPVAASAQEFITNGNFEQSSLNGPMQMMFWSNGDSVDTPAQYGKDIDGWVIDQHWGQNIFYYENATATSNNMNNRPEKVLPLSTSFDNVASVAGDVLQPGAVQADPETGGHFMAIDGNDLSQGDSSMYQTVSGLTVGETYQLSFDWGGVQLANWSGPTTESMRVWFGSAPLTGQVQSTITVAECTHCFSGWMHATMDFVAKSTTQVLTFQGMGTPSGSPPMLVLDGVSLTPFDQSPPVSAVPEASTWSTLLLGGLAIGAHGLLRRRSRREN